MDACPPTRDIDIDAWETRLVRRLCRLFRIERTGGFGRRSPTLVRQLIARRDAVIAEVIAAEAQRAGDARPSSPPLLVAMTELAFEIEQSQEPAAAQLKRLQAELRRRSGGPVHSGLRNTARGRLLGSG